MVDVEFQDGTNDECLLFFKMKNDNAWKLSRDKSTWIFSGEGRTGDNKVFDNDI